MAIPTALLAKVLGGLGVLATAATIISVTANRPKNGDTPEEPQQPTPEDPLKVLNEKINSLGIEDCELGDNESSKTCDLDKAKIEKIKFDGKAGAGLTPESASLTLKIEKGYDTNDFPEGLRFSFTNSNGSDVTIGNTGNEIKLLKNTTYDYKIKTSNNTTTLEKAWDFNNLLNNKVGLTCNDDTAGECSLGISNVSVWKGKNSYKTGVGSTPSDTKKIKVAKDSAGYRQGIKFYVEEETTLKTNDTPPKDYPLNKETSYEIDIREIEGVLGSEKQIVKKWFLVDKSTAKLNEKIKDLGITNCVLEEGKSKTQECSLDKEKIKTIKFDGKTEDTLSPESPSLTLTIERDHLGSDFPSGLRFTFTNSSESDVTIGSSSSPITFKTGFTYDYKIKTGGNDENKLEKAWTITTLADKVGLTCDSDTETECTLKTEGINAWRDENHYIINGQISEKDKKMEVSKDQKGYLEGFKFTLKDEEGISLQAKTKKTGNDGVDKLTKTNMSYGIDVKDIGGIKTWFLIEKSTTPA